MEISNKILICNFIWRFMERIGAQFIQFIVSVVLARIIAPEEYGTITLVLVFTQILQVFVDSGLACALIQKKDADELDFSSVFFFNVAVCIGLYIIIFMCTPLIAKFYGDLSLTSIVRVLSLSIVISGMTNIQQAYVSRTMQFKKFFFSTLWGTVASAIIGIGMALKGFGVWALVFQKLTNLFINTLVLWMTVEWRPKLMFSWERLRTLLGFGWKILIATLIDTIYRNLQNLVIGKVYSTLDLAFYNKGQQLPNLIALNVNKSIDSILLPVMSNVQENKMRVKKMTRRAITISTYIMAPLMIGLAVCARSVVHVLLTDKWQFCVPYMRIFCITSIFYSIHTANLNAITAMGRSDLFLKLEVAKKVVGITALLITIPISVKAMAYSLLIVSVLCQIINSWPNRKLLCYSYLEQIRDIMPNIMLATIMGIVVLMIEYVPLQNKYIILLLQVSVGGVVYFGLSFFTKVESYIYIKSMFGNVYQKNQRNKNKK